MTEKQLWINFCQLNQLNSNTPYEVWSYGNDADVLAELTCKRIKTATASGYDLYFILGEEEALPKEGEYSVILNAKGEAVCVIQTRKITILPYNQVGEEQAYKEGEGDRSLDYWRKVHWDFFRKEYADAGLEFTEKSLVVCEEFECLYKV